MPGFGPAAELGAWRVPTGATYRLVRLEERDLCVEQKWTKQLTPRPASSDWTDAKHGKAGQLAEPVLSPAEGLRQGPPIDKSVRPWGRAAGVGRSG